MKWINSSLPLFSVVLSSVILLIFLITFSARSSSSYPWLVALWRLSSVHSSFLALPQGSFFCGMRYFRFGFSLLFTGVTNTDFHSHHVLSRNSSYWLSFLLRVTPFSLFSPESSFSLVLPRSCVAVRVTQVIMVNECTMETSLWSGTSHAHPICMPWC